MRSLRVDTADEGSTAPLLVTPAAAATGGALLPPAASGGDASTIYPDANMVIVLAALLCILICALGLNSLVRCARHCLLATAAAPLPTTTTTTTAGGTVSVAAPAASAAGLNKRELRKIPVVEYETGAATRDDDDVPGTECAICLGEFADGEKVRLLPRCHHGFHVRCIDAWLAAHSSCPICRGSLLEEEDHAHAGAGGGEAATDAGDATS